MSRQIAGLKRVAALALRNVGTAERVDALGHALNDQKPHRLERAVSALARIGAHSPC